MLCGFAGMMSDLCAWSQARNNRVTTALDLTTTRDIVDLDNNYRQYQYRRMAQAGIGDSAGGCLNDRDEERRTAGSALP